MSLAALTAGECRTIADFGAPNEIDRWQVVNDGVMGGLSRGQIAPAGDAMRFWGEINTDGGGFSSIRHRLDRGELAGATHLRVTMDGDRRDYQLSLRSNARLYGRSIAYRGSLQPSNGVATVALDGLEPSIFGRRVPAPAFDPAAARSVGFILADGRDGPFEMKVRKIEACSA
ncbi:CIA30 family protein [Sphingomicrobium clamense]|uniref:CIA30 family protein n=1 Tax=Sphingomicrobium clamense TaxID=2851013 RepID=A0ABS6V3W7_9SPHN|nr:CIA30 family protein [Sphingomicrobium sp. B8]MBW0144243.1 CIA30 family protein [Sphingomicrobium sp. B8]